MEKELLVVKLGTSSLTDQNGLLDQHQFDAVANQVLGLEDTHDTVIVSSAAISAGAAELGVDRQAYKDDLDGKSMLASIGQHLLMMRWREAFLRKRVVGQHLVTPQELSSDNIEREAFLRKLAHAITQGVVPVVNENDAISDEEIKIGDNDQIAALVAVGLSQLRIWRRTSLINLSDVDGLYDGDPNDPSSKLIPVVSDLSAMDRYIQSTVSLSGSGGMRTKRLVAQIANAEGIDISVANARTQDVLTRVLSREVGTYFSASAVELTKADK